MTAFDHEGEPPAAGEHDSSGASEAGAHLTDLPLRPEPAFEFPARSSAPDEASPASALSSLPDRALGVAADVATSVLLVTLAVLAAFAVRGSTPRFEGLGWTAAFALYVSFFAVVVPLVLFGRTVGMALAGLVARDEGAGRRLTPGEAARRWAGTLATIAGLGLPLFWTAQDIDAPTLADRLSGRPLVREG